MKRTKFKNEYYGLGYFIGPRDFGFIRHGTNLQSLLQCQGERDYRIVRFTPQGLKTYYRYHHKLGWRKIS
jgi:hypothetical protein